jgi:hypothetical protein
VEGWLEVVLLAGFRNMTALTSDLAVIVEALRASKNLDISIDGFHARVVNYKRGLISQPATLHSSHNEWSTSLHFL